MNHWINMNIRLNDHWDPGADHSLSTPMKVEPEFSLRPRYLRDPQGNLKLAHFTVDFSSGYLSDGWQGVNFVPLGENPVNDISNLPGWDPKQRDVYRAAIRAAKSLADSRTARLEAVVPHLETGGVGYNEVRLFYIPNAVHGSQPHLVVVKTVTHKAPAKTVQARQDGSGHGGQH